MQRRHVTGLLRASFIFFSFLCLISSQAHAQIITTVAGNGIGGYSGDGGTATAAEFKLPYDMAFDPAGNMFVADDSNECIREINTARIISTFSGTAGFTGAHGDGGAASSGGVYFYTPISVTFDGAGNLYICDYSNFCVRVINTTGIIDRFAGNYYYAGFSGDGGAATASGAEFFFPLAAAADAAGNLYIVDQYNNRIRMVNTAGVLSTFAGSAARATAQAATAAMAERPPMQL